MWLVIPSACCPSSPGVEDSTSLSDSQSETLARSVMWRGTFRRPGFWRRAWKRAAWIRHLPGLTFDLFEAQCGVVEWTLSMGASPARTSRSRGRGRGSAARSPGSGESTLGSFARFDPGSSSLRTSQLSLLEDSTVYSETLPNSGSMRSGRLFRREPVELRTEGIESSSSRWTTPQAHDQGQGKAERIGRYGTKHGGRNLADDVMMWPTPNVPNGGRIPALGMSRTGVTPDGKKRQVGLENVARSWPTPSAVRYGRNKGGANPDGPERPSLDTRAKTWPADAACGPQGPKTKKGGEGGMVLDPRFVEALMGLPDNWTAVSIDYVSSEMELSQFRARWRSLLSSLGFDPVEL